MTRSAILAVLRPGQPGTESPFRTLRKAHCASAGLRIDLRTQWGQLLGSTHLYSALNTDAARAVRLQRPKVAKALAIRAAELERSPDAAAVQDAVCEIAGRMSLDPRDERAPAELQQYARLRGRSSWAGIDRSALAREWLVHSSAWFGHRENDVLVRAVAALSQAASEARAEIIGDALPPVSTYYGVVRRMDAVAAEVEGDQGARLVPRDDLERQGLAVLGQAVALLCETLPAGGSLVLPMPAVAMDRPTALLPDLYTEVDAEEFTGVSASVLGAADQAWLDRALAREPTAVPLAPISSA